MKNRVLTFSVLAIMFSFVVPAANTFALEGESASSETQSAIKTENILDAPVAGSVSGENVFQSEKPKKKLYVEQVTPSNPNGPIVNPGTKQKEVSSSSKPASTNQGSTPAPAATTAKTEMAAVDAANKTTGGATTSATNAADNAKTADNASINDDTGNASTAETQGTKRNSSIQVIAPKAGVAPTSSGDVRLVFTIVLILAASVMVRTTVIKARR